MKKSAVVLFFVLYGIFMHAQIPVEGWRDQLPYYHGTQIVEGNENVYCLADKNLFYYNKDDQSVNKLNKLHDLSDIEISAIAFSKKYNTLVVGYSSGNIDLVEDQTIINISDIKRKNTLTVKNINRIYIQDNLAYLATSFGIVVLDMVKREFKDTYFIGDLGTIQEVFDVAIDENNIYAAVNGGIKRADNSSSRLIDFNEWKKIPEFPSQGTDVKQLAQFNNSLYALVKHDNWNDDTIFRLKNNTWDVWEKQVATDYFSIRTSRDLLVVSLRYKVELWDANMQRTRSTAITNSMDAFLDDNDIIWMATEEKGMGINRSTWHIEYATPNGPLYNSSTDIQFADGKIWVAAGGSDDFYKYAYRGAYVFEDQRWTNINRKNTKGLSKFPNLYKLAIDPKNSNHVFAASFGYGIVEFNEQQVIDTFYTSNSLIRNMEEKGDAYALVSALDFDPNSNLFFCIKNIKNPFYVITKNGKMVNFEFDFEGYGEETKITDFIVTSNYHKWALIDGKGIFAFDDLDTPEDDSDDLEKFFVVRTDAGDELSNLKCITEDLDGNIWIGTSEGPVVYYNPEDVFSDDETVSNLRAHRIKLARNEGDNLADELLVTEGITDIAIDGADRKWFGTENSGAYLFSKDGLTQIQHFNEDNSYLFSNKINTIGIDHQSGEVFFGTEKGLISYRSDATAGDDDFKDVYVFPNPVREDYEGVITITGLASDVNVKITDVSGNLVYETDANGGQAVWDGRSLAGKRVATGIYLVFCTNEDGGKTFVTKLLFIN